MDKDKVLAPTSTVIAFGSLPITIFIPAGTFAEQRDVLEKRIKVHAKYLVENGVWQEPLEEEEMNRILKEFAYNLAVENGLKEIVFFRYNNVTLAINHGYSERNEPPFLPYSECAQYSTYKGLMDTVAQDLEGREDGRWTLDFRYCWQQHPMNSTESSYANRIIGSIIKP